MEEETKLLLYFTWMENGKSSVSFCEGSEVIFFLTTTYPTQVIMRQKRMRESSEVETAGLA
jgi:hypothetical protein